MDIRGKLAKHRDRVSLYFGLLLSAVFGFIFIYVARSPMIPNIWQEIVRDLGIAFLSASVLGITIHGWLESTVVRDVFRAAIGHVLPPELRDEVHWISSFKCIITRCVCDVSIEDIGDGIVKLTQEVDTEMKNITTKSQIVKRLFTKDEWGTCMESQILDYEYKIGDRETVKFSGAPERRKDKTVQIHMDNVSLPAGEIIRTFARGVEYRRNNDRFFDEWIYPVVRPELNIRSIPESIEYFAEFSHDPPISVIQNGRRHILEGTLMPHQKMGLRWFPKDS